MALISPRMRRAVKVAFAPAVARAESDPAAFGARLAA